VGRGNALPRTGAYPSRRIRRMRLGVTDACTIGGNPHGKQAVLRALEASTVSDENEGVLGGRIIALLAADEDILTSSIPKMPPCLGPPAETSLISTAPDVRSRIIQHLLAVLVAVDPEGRPACVRTPIGSQDSGVAWTIVATVTRASSLGLHRGSAGVTDWQVHLAPISVAQPKSVVSQKET
jgi:hypothetical protein